MTVKRTASAKINLMLHVTGRLPDGYHHLQSLITFASLGDEVSVEKADRASLTIDGPFARETPLGPENSIVLAAQWLRKQYPDLNQFHIHLTKNLPVSSGIGGGSSDAAATIAAILESQGISLTREAEDALIIGSGVLGADVPVCLAHQLGRGPLLWVDGSGREFLPVSLDRKLPGVLVLVNPGVSLSTAAVFQRVQPPYTARQELQNIPENEILGYLKNQGNDLMEPAAAEEPSIRQTISALQSLPGCLLALLSGSGATCFGLFENETLAKAACAILNNTMPPTGWCVYSA